MTKLQLEIPVLPQNTIEERFEFIEDPIIKQNVSIYVRYLVYLYSLAKIYTLPSVIEYSLYKDIIIYSAQVAEAVCYYSIKKLLDKKILKSSCLGTEWCKTGFRSNIELKGKDKRIETIVMKKKNKDLGERLGLEELHRICTRAKFPDNFCDALKDLQNKRNNIHIGELEYVDDTYVLSDVENSFSNLAIVIEEFKSRFE